MSSNNAYVVFYPLHRAGTDATWSTVIIKNYDLDLDFRLAVFGVGGISVKVNNFSDTLY